LISYKNVVTLKRLEIFIYTRVQSSKNSISTKELCKTKLEDATVTYYYLAHCNNNGKNLGDISMPILYFTQMQIQLDFFPEEQLFIPLDPVNQGVDLG
jgi:hypothetical protein